MIWAIPAERFRRQTPASALGLLPYTTGIAATACVTLVAIKAGRQPSFPYLGTVTAAAIGAVLAAILLASLRSRVARLPVSIDADGVVSWLLGLQLGILLLPVPTLALVAGVSADHEQWTWPFLNKRWLVPLYFVGVATFVVLPVACQWLRSTSRLPWPSPDATAARGPVRRFSVPGAGAAILLAWFFAGPPWHLDRHFRDLEYHEQVHLGPLQAIAKGYAPYLGPASTQYGPGSQRLLYAVMRRAARFDLVAYRESWALVNFAALVIVALVASYWLAPVPAAAAVILAAVYSPLSFYGTLPDGTFGGFFGWANALRYLAPLLVTPMLVRVAGSRSVVLLGVVWAVGSWMAQENLLSTAASAGLLLALLALTRTTTLGSVLRSARDLVLGFALAAVPLMLYYASQHAASEFLDNYFALPRAVSAGLQNTWWPPHDSAVRTFYATPLFLVGLSIATLWRLPALTLRAPLDEDAALFLALLCVQLVCYAVALLRSDAAHLQNTMIALPFILVLGAQQLPKWLATTARRRSKIRWAFVLIALAMLPAGRLLRWREILVTPYTRFVSRGTPPPIDARPAYARARPSDHSFERDDTLASRRAWLEFADEVHGIIGGRKTYVASMSLVSAGALYFLADLMPAPFPLDADTMILNARARLRIVDDMGAHPDRYEAYVGTSLDAPEAQAFIGGHPDARRVERLVG